GSPLQSGKKSSLASSSAHQAKGISWNDPAVRSLVYQALALALIGWVAWFLVSNTLQNLATRNITTGFDFLHREAGFAIGESVIPYSPEHTYGRAITVGILNTLRVSA